MIYAALVLIVVLNALYSTIKVPLDFAYLGFVLTRETNRPFALATYVAIGLVRDALFLSKPWYSALLMTVGVILINRVRPHWVILTATVLLIYGVDLLLRLTVWGVRVDFQEALYTAVGVALVSFAYHRVKERELTIV